MKLPIRALPVLVLLTSAMGPLFAQSNVSPVKVTAFPSGINRYEPGVWASVGIQATNQTEAEANPFIAVYFGNQEQTQFARKVWLPPKAMRKTWLPVRLPPVQDLQKQSISMTLMPLLDSSQGEVLQRRAGLEMLHSAFVTIDREVVKAAGMFRKLPPDRHGLVPEVDADAYELYVHVKQLADGSRVLMDFTDDLVPPHIAMWDSLDQFVLCSDRILDDSAGLRTLRNWLQRGGQLWVFIDRVDPTTVEAIIGHAQCYQIVDRVELTNFTIEGFPRSNTDEGRDVRQFEQPVELVRVLTGNTEVVARVNSWPAAFIQRVGAGEVLFIALSPNGWLPPVIRPGEEQLPENTSREFRSTEAVNYLAKRFFNIIPEEAPVQPVAQPILQEQIGYRIPRRGLAAALLGLNCAALVVGGGWFAARKRLDHLAWLTPVLALTTTLLFVFIGRQNNRSVPPTVAFTQLIRVFPDNEEATVSGLAGLYHQEATALTMSGGAGGLVEPLAAPTGGTIRRLLWTDQDRGHWQNVVLPGGSVQFVDFRRPVPKIGSVHATARFGANGLEGQVNTGMLGKLDDVVITNVPAPSLYVSMQEDGTFVCGPDQVLPADQFTSARVLTDEARRRQAIYRQVVNAQDDDRLGRGANLLGWAPPVDTGIDWPSDLQKTGAALVAIPVRFERTLSGKPFVVPATFLPAKAGKNESGQSMSYNDRTGVWFTGLTRATRTALRFVLPPEVLPCQVTNARMTIKLSAPSRRLRVYSVVNRQEQLVFDVANPSGVYPIQIDEAATFPPSVDDSLSFTIEITESGDERQAREEMEKKAQERIDRPEDGEKNNQRNPPLAMSFSTWQIDYVRLDVSGVVK